MELSPEVLDRFGIPRVSSLSYTDDLTGLPNRRFLRSVLESLTDSGGPFSVLFIDLDDFKQVNDSAGHAEGDSLLRRLGAILKDSLRKRDLVARYGGDEFVVILSGGEKDEGIMVAEKVIASVDRELGSVWGVSASVGISCFPEHARVASDLIAMADNAMYSAKASGKSCWRLAAPEGTSLFWHEDVFMARNRELDRALELLSGDEANSLVLVTGDTGSGKTSFLGVVAENIQGRRTMRLEGRPELSVVPWAAMAASVRRYAPEFPEVRLKGIWSNLLGRLVPDVFGESTLKDTIMDRFALMDAFSRVLSGWGPLLLLVDNAHWLDIETASMLGYALESGVCPGLTVCACATEDPTSEDAATLELLRRLGVSSEIRLEPLSRFQTAEMIKGRLGVAGGVDDFADMVYRFSGGNPLFACEYIRTMLNSGLLSMEERKLLPFSQPSSVPDRIRSIVAGKLNLLAPDTRRILQQASVLRKEPLELGLLALMTSRTEGEMLSAMDEGIRQGILRTSSEDNMSFHFTNEAFREEVYTSAGTSAIARYHSFVAERRMEEGDHLNAGYHLKMSGRDLEALEVFRRGAEQSLRSGLPTAAVSCLEEAEELSRRIPESRLPADELAALKYDLLNAYRCAGNWKKTRKLAQEYSVMADEMGLEEKAMTSRVLAADCLRMAGQYPEALKELSSLEPQLRGTTLVDCLIRAADSLSRMGGFGEAREKLDSAEEVLKDSADEGRRMDVDLLHQNLVLTIAEEDFSRGMELAGKLLDISRRTQDDPWWYFYDIAETALLAGRPIEAIQVFHEGIERARHLAALHGVLVIRAEMADALYHALDLKGAAEELDRTEELAGRFGEVKVLDDVSLLRAQLAMETGNPGSARNRIDELLCRQPESPSVAVVNSYLMELEQDLAGSRQEAARALELLRGRSMGSIIDSSVLVTVDEIRLQEAWTSSLVDGSDWKETAESMMPGLNARAAFRARGLLALWLHEKGRTGEAEEVMSRALSEPGWTEMRLYRYRCLLIRSMWDISAAEEARDLMEKKNR